MTKEDVIPLLCGYKEVYKNILLLYTKANKINLHKTGILVVKDNHYIAVLKSMLNDHLAIELLLKNNLQMQACSLIRTTFEKVILLVAQEYIYTNCKNSDPSKRSEVEAYSTYDIETLLSDHDKDKKIFSYHENGRIKSWRPKLLEEQVNIHKTENKVFNFILNNGNKLYKELCNFTHPNFATKDAITINSIFQNILSLDINNPQWSSENALFQTILIFPRILNLGLYFAAGLFKNIWTDEQIDAIKRMSLLSKEVDNAFYQKINDIFNTDNLTWQHLETPL